MWKTLCNFEPQICLEMITSHDAKSAGMAACVNSSPPLISRRLKLQGLGGIWAKSGKFRGISGKFRGIQNLMGFCMTLNMNSVGIFGATPGLRGNLGFGVVSGDLGPQKAFVQIASAGFKGSKTASDVMISGVFPDTFSFFGRQRQHHVMDVSSSPFKCLCTKSLQREFSMLGPTGPRALWRWNSDISATKRGMINSEEFWEKFWWVILHSKQKHGTAQKTSPNFSPIFSPNCSPNSKICRRNFALGSVSQSQSQT